MGFLLQNFLVGYNLLDRCFKLGVSVRDIGSVLKKARRAKKQSLAQIASKLKIRLRYLKEVEDGIENGTPFVYKIGYIKVYANHLGVDINKYLQGLSVDSESKFSPIEESYLEQTKPPLLTVGIAAFCICLSIIVIAIYNIRDNAGVSQEQVKVASTAQLFVNSESSYLLENLSGNLVAVVAVADLGVKIQDEQGTLLDSWQLKAGDSHALPVLDKLTVSVDVPNSLEFYEFSPITMEKRQLVAVTK